MKGPALKETIVTQTVRGLLILVMTLALSAHTARAQTGVGTIAGTVSDLSGAVVPGANLTLTNRETGVVRRLVTSDAGAFHFGAIPRGQYTLDVELTGFKKWSGKLELQVGQSAKVDPVLEVGQVQNVVEVSGAAAPITLESSDVSDVKDYQRIRQLPLNGRAISSLFDLTPGVEGGGNARVSGMKVGSLEITLDGISMVDRFGGGIARIQPGLDTIQEFRIETVGSDARFSRPATVTLATRSGTNQFHGTVFETHRNNQGGLLAHRREEAAGATKPHLVRNEFGVSAGGPLLLGKLYDGHDKTFWFGAYEGLVERSTNFANDRVPTAAMWAGDLSNIVDANGRPTIIYDPLTTDANGVRQPFPGNIIPGNRISAFAREMQSLTGAPTSSLNPHLGNNYQRFYPVKQDRNNLTLKGDHTLTDKDRLSVRWTRSVSNGATEGGVFGNPIDASAGFGTSRSDAVVNNVSINHTRTFSPTLLNELLVGAHRSYKSSGTLADFEDWPKTLGVPNPFGAQGWPTMYAVSGDAEFGWDADNRKDEALTAGCRLAIASTTTAVNIDALLNATFGACGLEMFSVIACGDQVRAKKPAPDIFRLALEHLGVEADDAVALEDSANGLRSAHAAGLWTVVTPTFWTEGSDFGDAGLLLPSLGDPAHPLAGEPGDRLHDAPWLSFAELARRARPARTLDPVASLYAGAQA